MKENSNLIFVIFLILSESLKCLADRVALSSEAGLENDLSVNTSDVFNRNRITRYAQRTVVKYNCFAESSYFVDAEIETLAYGENSWKFPQQTVNLSLAYPLEKHDDLYITNDRETHQIVSGFQVILHYDGKEISGYIETGGMLEKSITLSFLMRDTSMVAYQFWLFGFDKAAFTTNEDKTKWTMTGC